MLGCSTTQMPCSSCSVAILHNSLWDFCTFCTKTKTFIPPRKYPSTLPRALRLHTNLYFPTTPSNTGHAKSSPDLNDAYLLFDETSVKSQSFPVCHVTNGRSDSLSAILVAEKKPPEAKTPSFHEPNIRSCKDVRNHFPIKYSGKLQESDRSIPGINLLDHRPGIAALPSYRPRVRLQTLRKWSSGSTTPKSDIQTSSHNPNSYSKMTSTGLEMKERHVPIAQANYPSLSSRAKPQNALSTRGPSGKSRLRKKDGKTLSQQPHQREPWQVQKSALTDKFGSQGWKPRKRLSPDALEGIRALHTQYPEKYTTPVLADQFKVSPEAIRRILKSKWRPNEEEEADRRRRWDTRGEGIWSQMVEIGIKPPKKWREMGVGKSFRPPEVSKKATVATDESLEIPLRQHSQRLPRLAQKVTDADNLFLSDRIL